MRCSLLAVAVAGSLSLASLAAAAQARAQADSARAAARAVDRPRAADDCVADSWYDACALRYEEGRIRRGQSGETLVRLGWFTNVGRRVPWLSDSARYHVGRYQSIHTTATLIRAVALGGSIAALVLGADAKIGDDPSTDDVARYDKSKVRTATILSISSTVVGVAGGLLNRRAKRHMSRAVWWHNRALAQR